MVTADPDEAEAALERGERVVLIVAPGAGGHEAARPGDGGPGAGRLAVFVGDVADPAVWEAAATMDKELFM